MEQRKSPVLQTCPEGRLSYRSTTVTFRPQFPTLHTSPFFRDERSRHDTNYLNESLTPPLLFPFLLVRIPRPTVVMCTRLVWVAHKGSRGRKRRRDLNLSVTRLESENDEDTSKLLNEIEETRSQRNKRFVLITMD